MMMRRGDLETIADKRSTVYNKYVGGLVRSVERLAPSFNRYRVLSRSSRVVRRVMCRVQKTPAWSKLEYMDRS